MNWILSEKLLFNNAHKEPEQWNGTRLSKLGKYGVNFILFIMQIYVPHHQDFIKLLTPS